MELKNIISSRSIDFNVLFPFFFRTDSSLVISEAGHSLQKMFPGIDGKSITDIFCILKEVEISAISYAELLNLLENGTMVVLKSVENHSLLRGYFFRPNDAERDIFFLGNPCITSPNKLEELSLTVNDFAGHDTIIDTIRLIQNQKRSNNEIKLIAENHLTESDLLHKIMDLVPQQIFLKDSQHRFMLVNKKMSELFGADIPDIIGKTDNDFWGKREEVDFYADIDRKVIETGQRFEIPEEPQTLRDGTKTINRVVKMPFTLPNGEKCILGIAIDITDIKEAEQAKFEIASGVLHDIGNAVVGFGSYLTRIKRSLEQNSLGNLENLAAFFASKQEEMTDVIGDAKARAVLDMLNGITQTQKAHQEEIRKSIAEQFNIISHIQEILNIQRQYVTGYETHERKPVVLRAIINDCMAMVFASVDKRNIVVALDINATIPTIKGDRTKLMQVILNILKNSVEAIDINAPEKNISIRLYADSDLVTLQVQDSGSGFDRATSERLFERGFTTKSTGSGLGLYNCRTIIESHGGTIDITSEGHGKGAIATIQFKI